MYLEEALTAFAGARAVVLTNGAVGADGAELVGVEVLLVSEGERLNARGRRRLGVSDRRVPECTATSGAMCVSRLAVMMLIEPTTSSAYAIKRRVEDLSAPSVVHDASWEAGRKHGGARESRSMRHQKSLALRPTTTPRATGLLILLINSMFLRIAN